MKKIVPVTMLVLSILTVAVSIIGLTAVSVATKTNELALFAVPVAIVSFVLSTLGGGFSFLFKKDVLCKISFWIDLTSFVLSVTAIAVWLACIL